MGLKIMKQHFQRMDNKQLIIHIRSEIAVNQIRNIWRIKNPKLYFLHCIVMSLLENVHYYIEYIQEDKNREVK